MRLFPMRSQINNRLGVLVENAIKEQNEKSNHIDLLKALTEISTKIQSDYGGGSPLSKTFLMANLAIDYELLNYVEIGVYRGKSFFPLAYAAKQLDGMAYGIDPYDLLWAKEFDLEEEKLQTVNTFLESLDFKQMYKDVLALQTELNVENNSHLIQLPSATAVKYFIQNQISIDLLHIDGNHDSEHVLEDVELYLPLMSQGGLVVLDDVDWDSVRPALNALKRKYELLFNNGLFAIFSVVSPTKKFTDFDKLKFKTLHNLADNIENIYKPKNYEKPLISVIVSSFNHEQYIAECMEGILAQKGEFNLEIIVGDDRSTDSTLAIIKNYLDMFENSAVLIKYFADEDNLGITKNLERCLKACSGDYIAICEGDDYWLDNYKLQKQVMFLKTHPECSFCFNDFYFYYQEKDEYSEFDQQQKLSKDVYSTIDLIDNNFIGNFSCCLYDSRYLKKIPTKLFDIFAVDWIFNIVYSQLGDIGHLNEKLSVYRKHNSGVWSGKTDFDQYRDLFHLINIYNKFLDFDYDKEFCVVQKRLEQKYPQILSESILDIVLFDDIFPHPLSAFRYMEFVSYLHAFNDIIIYSSGISMKVLGKENPDEIIIKFKKKYLDYADRIKRFHDSSLIYAKLAYFVFLNNSLYFLDIIEKSEIPFIFTLYPGGGFGLNNKRSDELLCRITNSPYFRKVIVTQQATYDYLLEKGFCRPDQIRYIFGVVTPLNQIESDNPGKKNFGFEKDTMDICFVAHKYLPRGEDKGYDVFIDVAHLLCRKFNNVRFHVVGGYTAEDIDISEIRDRISFYGNQNIEWFDNFYKDKDIILSPNIPNKIYAGSFDGFPTGSCTDAGLKRTAIFCTDVLSLNNGRFLDGKEIVIISHDSGEIVEVITNYYLNPPALRSIGENGYSKIKKLYCYESQISPRLQILIKEIDQWEQNKTEIVASIE